jgi:UDP-glucose 4-epimerase
VRRAARTAAAEPDSVAVGDLAAPVDWTAALAGVDTVFHLAARVHDPRDDAAARLAFERVNVAATAGLAKAAARAGVRRFVFASSVKAAGETSGPRPLQEDDAPHPQDSYGQSKWAAEQALLQVPRDTGRDMTIAILRPPLVYGPGVRANFHALLRLACSRYPLPLRCATARRSFVYVGNLVDALIASAEADAEGVATYFVSDGEDLSVAELVCRIRRTAGRSPGLWPVPAPIAKGLARLAGRGDVAARLFEPLQVSTEKIRAAIGWRPPFVLDDALRLTVRAHAAQSTEVAAQ